MGVGFAVVLGAHRGKRHLSSGQIHPMEIRPGNGCRSEWGKPFAKSRTPRDLFSVCGERKLAHIVSE